MSDVSATFPAPNAGVHAASASAASLAAGAGDFSAAEPAEAVARAAEALQAVRSEIGKRVIGQQTVVDHTLISILCGGHGLLVGAPGLAKTRLVEAFGVVLGMNAKRVQFTPDLMPADILGAEVLEENAGGGRAFRFIEGPIFCQLLMADEINRASPRTQSALLQAMQEKHVTVAGQRRDLPAPFHVLATQNPIEQEGTYPLPEAQLDRFLLQIDVGYPSREDERRIVLDTTGAVESEARQVIDAGALTALQNLVRRLPVGDSVVDAILTLVRSARPEEADAHPRAKGAFAWGPGPRAAQALTLAVRARALIEGRFAPTMEDVAMLAPAALKHRVALSWDPRDAEGKPIDLEAIDRETAKDEAIAALIEHACG